jgi:hypothetical protein
MNEQLTPGCVIHQQQKGLGESCPRIAGGPAKLPAAWNLKSLQPPVWRIQWNKPSPTDALLVVFGLNRETKADQMKWAPGKEPAIGELSGDRGYEPARVSGVETKGGCSTNGHFVSKL